MRRLLIVFFVASVTLLSCDSKGNYSQEEQSYFKQNNDLAFSVIRYLQEVDSSENVVFSPLLLMTNLSLVANGTDGETLKEFKQFLGVKEDKLDILNSFCKKVINSSSENDSVSIFMGNFVAINKGKEIMNSFIDAVQTNYEAEVESMDFGSKSSVERINKWCSILTHGKIPEIIDGLNEADVMCLLSSIYFEGQWQAEELFEESRIELGEFTNEQGIKSMVPMMWSWKKFDYYKGDNFASLSIPYKGGYDFVVLLPDEGTTLKTMTGSFSQNQWEKMLTQYSDTNDIILKLPKYDIEFNFSLNDFLKKAGVVTAFDPVQAKFESICKQKIYLSKVEQRSKISVNEKGTQAASITSERMVQGFDKEPIDFFVTRPFLYIIKESSTGAILFIGFYNGEKE